VASSIPRLVHESAHHLYESCSALTPIRRALCGLFAGGA
jgi:hypothetical protein